MNAANVKIEEPIIGYNNSTSPCVYTHNSGSCNLVNQYASMLTCGVLAIAAVNESYAINIVSWAVGTIHGTGHASSVCADMSQLHVRSCSHRLKVIRVIVALQPFSLCPLLRYYYYYAAYCIQCHTFEQELSW